MNIKKRKIRRSMLFVPANNAGFYKDIAFLKPDSVIFDLEDAVSVNEKDAARQLVFHMLEVFDYQSYDIEVCIRINGDDTPFYHADLQMVTNSKADVIRIPKVTSQNHLLKMIHDIETYEKKAHRKKPLKLFCAIESAIGVINAYQIASASERIVGIALGGADYLNDLKATHTKDRHELFFARSMLVHAARAAKIDCFDVVFFNVNDLEGLKKEAQYAKELGFSGKSVIHAKQIAIVNEVFSPTPKEIEKAITIVKA